MARRPTPQMVADGVELYRQFKPHIFSVEANQFQELLAPEFATAFRQQGLLDVNPWLIHNDANKRVRIRRLGPLLAARRIRLKNNCPSTKLLLTNSKNSPSPTTTTAPTPSKCPSASPPNSSQQPTQRRPRKPPPRRNLRMIAPPNSFNLLLQARTMNYPPPRTPKHQHVHHHTPTPSSLPGSVRRIGSYPNRLNQPLLLFPPQRGGKRRERQQRPLATNHGSQRASPLAANSKTTPCLTPAPHNLLGRRPLLTVAWSIAPGTGSTNNRLPKGHIQERHSPTAPDFSHRQRPRFRLANKRLPKNSETKGQPRPDVDDGINGNG